MKAFTRMYAMFSTLVRTAINGRFWSDSRVALLGDAAHPMTPYMAQGAATSIEDAAILARCLEAVNGDDVEGAFKRYEAHRKPRTSEVQAISSANTWM